ARMNKELLKEFLKDPIAYNERISQQVMQKLTESAQRQIQQSQAQLQTVNEAIGRVASQYPDFQSLQPAIENVVATQPVFRKMLDTLHKDPVASVDDYASLVQAAYLVAKSNIASASLQSAREQGRNEASQAHTQRRSAQTTTQSARRDQSSETAEERIRREIA